MKTKKIPMRRCIACGNSRPKKELIRIVAGEDGRTVDPTGRKNGRGEYLCRDRACFDLALKKHLIDEATRDELTGMV